MNYLLNYFTKKADFFEKITRKLFFFNFNMYYLHNLNSWGLGIVDS